MKKILTTFIFFIFSITTIFANSTINRIRLNTNPPQLVFDITSNTTPKFTTNYDEFNRLLFLEVEKTKMGAKFNSSNFVGKNIEKFDMIDYGSNLGFFIKLKKDSGHRVYTLNNPRRIVVDLRPPNTQKKQFTVAIDAGHGGKDSGAVGFNKYKEKDIALAVSKKLQTRLSKDFNVIMTRSTDTFVSLSERSKIANRGKADLFVSIHLNASTNASAQGMEIFYFSKKSSPYAEKIAAYENSFGEKYGEKTTSIAQIMGELSYNKNMEKSLNIAKPLNTSIAKTLKMRDRGTHGANFAVLRGFNGPGILVELGFITNKDDIAKLSKDSNQNIAADELAKKIRAFFY